jgi:hypothetical protein
MLISSSLSIPPNFNLNLKCFCCSQFLSVSTGADFSRLTPCVLLWWAVPHSIEKTLHEQEAKDCVNGNPSLSWKVAQIQHGGMCVPRPWNAAPDHLGGGGHRELSNKGNSSLISFLFTFKTALQPLLYSVWHKGINNLVHRVRCTRNQNMTLFYFH